MASISSSLTLVDNFTGTIDRYINKINRTTDCMEKANATANSVNISTPFIEAE